MSFRLQRALALGFGCTLQLGLCGAFTAQIGGEGTQKDGASRVESLQYELQESSHECMVAENEAMSLWEEQQLAEDRSLTLEKTAAQRSGARGGQALMAAMLEWQTAQEHAAELWTRYAKAEERAGALREREVENAEQGQNIVQAEEQTRKMRLRAETLQHEGAPLKEAVQKWQEAEEHSSETWSRFVGLKDASRTRLVAAAASERASHLEEQDVEDEVEIERVLAEATRAAANATSAAVAAIPGNLAAHLEAATALVGAAKEAAAHLAEVSATAGVQKLAPSHKNALSQATTESQVAQESQAAKESFAQDGSSSLGSSSSNALGRFNGHPESFTDLSEKFEDPLGGPDGFSVAFTARWDKLNRWSRVLDFGSGVGMGGHGGNNIIVANEKESDAFAFHIYGNSSNACLTIPDIIKVGDASRYLCSVDQEGHMRVYQEGRLVGEKKHGLVPPAVHREHLYIGKSNFKGNAMFEGEIRDLCVWNGAVTWEDAEGCAAS